MEGLTSSYQFSNWIELVAGAEIFSLIEPEFVSAFPEVSAAAEVVSAAVVEDDFVEEAFSLF